MSRVTLTAVVLLLLGACSKPAGLPAPLLASIEPSQGRAGKPLPVVLRGENFYLRVERRLGSATTVDDRFSAQLGDVPLEQVVRVDDHTLTAVIPAIREPGSYSLTVERNGQRVTLDNAFTVTPAETDCNNGLDEDGDGQVDCLDSDCLGDGCDDGDACTVTDVCGAGGTCSGSTRDCPANGPCQVGACQSGACVLLPVPDAVCDDGVACSFGDRCDSTGTCVGTAYACSAPNGCSVGSCLGDGGCGFTATPGASCGTAGICQQDGGCVGDGPFDFTPSNFIADAFPTPTETLVVDNCVAAMDSTNDTWVLPCSAIPTLPTPRRITLVDGTEADLFLFKSLTITANSGLAFVGSRPVVIAVYGDATIDGFIFANSEIGQYARNGSGANPLVCGASTGAPARSSRGGGGGGSLTGRGGNGGGSTGGDAGVPVTALSLEPLRGGCAGASGSLGGAVGGSGGGALQLSVSGTLVVNGVLSVSGAAGGGANASSAGGGGGGSGGMLLLEAGILKVSSSARLTANGGGGGGGAGAGSNKQGADGTSGSVDAGIAAPGGAGGTGSLPGGAGGAGEWLGGLATDGGNSASAGSGGGGGGGGAVILRSTSGNCVVAQGSCSPAAMKLNCP